MSDTRPMAGMAEICAHLHLPKSTIYDQRHRGVGIGALAIKVGRHLRWRWEDVDRWLDEQQTAGDAA